MSSTASSTPTLDSSTRNSNIDFILPTSGKLFYEQKEDFQLCKPHLMPLKSVTLEKLEKMQRDAQKQLQETRARTAAANEKFA